MKKKMLMALAAFGLAQSAAAQVSDNVVRIGVLNDQSGLYADLAGPGSTLAAQMAVEDFGGSVLGKPVEIVSGDHQNKPDIASSLARRWIDNERVDAIVDIPHSASALAVLGVAREKNKALLLSGPAYVEFTGKECSPITVHWTYDSYAMANGTAGAVVKQGGNSWFFLTGDNAGSHSQERDAMAFVKKAGGQVNGAIRHPLNTADFSSFLLQAQQSKAKVIGLANAGNDTILAVRAAADFGIVSGGQKVAAMLTFLSDIHALGLKTAQGLQLTESFYWNLNDGTRAWSKRFGDRMNGRMPTMVHAGVYSALTHYLKAVKATGSTDADKVAAAMRDIPVSDVVLPKASVRQDGRIIRPYYLFEVKKPEESKAPYDYYKLVREIPGEEAARPLNEGNCPLVK